ncbi:phosphotransferase family protein [Paenibacillus sp. YN15]|uniref:phosphotransferase family protein n=1 Tax=Paenibacillus sp. YN15 TaxID=1742774 RepID=UPI0015EC4873|nr:aminoglycoside phosphotransferase family protein [Paenibacillus sp. YN15]
MAETAFKKIEMPACEAEKLIRLHLGEGASELELLTGGNLSTVYAFTHQNRGYVAKFSPLPDDYKVEKLVSGFLEGRHVPYPACVGQSTYGAAQYVIQERMGGKPLASYSAEEKRRQFPQLFRILSQIHSTDISGTRGFGWLTASGDGAYGSWEDYVAAMFGEEQERGSFWHDWMRLFKTSCLEKDVFEECYNRLLAYLPYNAPHRHLLHGDVHAWNLLSDGTGITGIVDGNFLYGDIWVDVVNLDRHLAQMNVVEAYLNSLGAAADEIPHFRERLKGAYYFKGVDALRFYAKMGYRQAYEGTRQFLLGLD